jgi:hypothetical protein
MSQAILLIWLKWSQSTKLIILGIKVYNTLRVMRKVGSEPLLEALRHLGQMFSSVNMLQSYLKQEILSIY